MLFHNLILYHKDDYKYGKYHLISFLYMDNKLLHIYDDDNLNLSYKHEYK